MKKVSFLSLLLLLIDLTIPKQGQNCGGNYIYYNMLFDRDLVFSNGNSLTSFNLWNYNSSLYGTYPVKLQNAIEWANFLENKYIAKDLIPIIYREDDFTTHAKEMSNLRQARMSEKDISQKEIVFINYLELALQIEDHLKAYVPNPWDYEENETKKNPEEYQRLVNKTQQMLQVAQHQMIKERLAFQLIKLHRYEENYQEVINLYEKNFVNSKSFIAYWAMDHYAGTLAKIGRKSESNYYFSKVYINSPSRRESAYLSISFNSDQEMTEAKNLCQTNDEKLALHFIRGMESKNLAIDDIDFIIKNGGNHEYARVLISYEINKLEKILLNRDELDNLVNPVTNKNDAVTYLNRLINLNKQIINVDDVSKFWHVSLAYLYFLNKDYSNSKAILDGNVPTDPNLKRQYTVIEILNYVSTKNELSVVDENVIGHKLYEINDFKENLSSISSTNSKNPEIIDYSYFNSYRKGYEDYNTINQYIFELIYSKVKGKNAFKELIFNGQTIETDLYCRDFSNWNEQEQGKKALTTGYIDELISSLESTDKTKLTEYASNYYFSNDHFKVIKSILHEIKATLLMRNPEKLNEAISIFEQLPEYFNWKLTRFTDPFYIGAKNPIIHKANEYGDPTSKLELAKQLQQFYEKAKSTNSANDYFQLGVAYYNLSYYSDSWNFLAYYRCSTSPNGFTDNRIAMNFLNKALSIGLKDREMEAKAHFMAARCELNLFTQSYGEIYVNYGEYQLFDKFLVDINQQGFQKNFAALKKSYSNTNFYQEIVSECSYFASYISK
jgi:hypothetical protein